MSPYPEGYTRVSDILADVGLSDKTFIPDRALERGTVIHEACRLATLGQLDWDTLHEDLKGYAKSWLLLRDAVGGQIVAMEQPIQHDALRICGTPDLIWKVGEEGIYDWKSNLVPKHTRYQLALYNIIRGKRGPRYGIALQADGSMAKLVPFVDDSDYTVAMAAITLYFAKRNK